MSTNHFRISQHLAAIVGSSALAALAGCASTYGDHDATPHAHASTSASSVASSDDPALALPPGWTAEDMQACMAAGTPGEMHAHLARGAGVWHGRSTAWMAPGAEPLKSECTSTITSVMDGRYVQCEMKGDMPGMGPFHGLGFNGFDNVSQKFVSTWIDNHSTGMMKGVGELSADGKTMTWTYEYNCPLTKKPTSMREIQRTTGDRTMTMEMFGTDPKSGQEYKMMEIEFTKQS